MLKLEIKNDFKKAHQNKLNCVEQIEKVTIDLKDTQINKCTHANGGFVTDNGRKPK